MYMDAPDRTQDGLCTRELLEQEILRRIGKQWGVGEWLPPIPDLARLLHAGQVNTQRAVAALARQGYLLSLRGKGTLVRRRPPQSQPGDEPTNAQLYRVALVHAYNTDPFLQQALTACRQVLLPHCRRLEVVGCDGQNAPLMLRESFDGLVLLNPSQEMLGMAAGARHALRLSLAQPHGQSDQDEHDIVGIDQLHGGYLAGRALRLLEIDGCCFIGRAATGTEFDPTSAARLAGFEQGWGDQLDSESLMYGRFYGPTTGAHAYRRWKQLSPRPQGIFACNDEIAVGFLLAALADELRPGIDFQLIGFDGQERGKLPEATLTTVTAPMAALGLLAGQQLLTRLHGSTLPPVHQTLRCHLEPGHTTAASLIDALASAADTPPLASDSQETIHDSHR